jgi:hypothetical protein
MNPEELFTRARRELEQLALDKANVAEDKHPSVGFIGLSILFLVPPETFRLSWDEKEQALILEWTPDEEQFRLNMWEDVGLWTFSPDRRSDQLATEILSELNEEFQICLAQTGS